MGIGSPKEILNHAFFTEALGWEVMNSIMEGVYRSDYIVSGKDCNPNYDLTLTLTPTLTLSHTLNLTLILTLLPTLTRTVP